MGKSIKKNYTYNLCYQLLLLITPLITTPYLSRVLGPNGVGEVSFAESIVAYFTLFAVLGITTYGQREISYVLDDKAKRTYVFWETKSLEIITGLIALILYIPFSLCQSNPNLYLVLSLNIIAVIFDVTWFFQGLEEFGKIVFRNFVFKVINIIYIFVLIRTKEDVVLYAFGLAFFLFLSNVSLWIYLRKYVNRPPKNINPFRDIKVVLTLFIPTIAMQIYTVMDKTMIGIITNSAFENGVYEQAIKLSKMVMTVVTSLGTVMIPRIGFHFSKGDLESVRRYMYRGYRFVWFIGIPLCFGLLSTASNFVPWFFGEGYEKVVPLLGILAFLILAIGINNVTGMQYLIPTKRQNTFTLTVIIGAIVNFILNLILIHFFLSIGAAIASVVAETVIALVQIYIVRKELSPKKIFTSIWPYLLSGLVMLIAIKIISNYMAPSIIHTAILMITGASIYFALLFVMRDEFFITSSMSIIKKIFKKEITSKK